LLTETGLVGLGLFLAVVVYWACDAWRLWSNTAAPLGVRQQGLLMLAVLGVYFLNGMFHEVSVAPMANMILFFLAGITAALRPQREASGFRVQGSGIWIQAFYKRRLSSPEP
jgi:cbb3-type cytochrome oxidase subunit 3